MPRPRANTQVLAVPRSIATSVPKAAKKRIRWCLRSGLRHKLFPPGLAGDLQERTSKRSQIRTPTDDSGRELGHWAGSHVLGDSGRDRRRSTNLLGGASGV